MTIIHQQSSVWRIRILIDAILLAVFALNGGVAFAADGPKITLNTANAAPREIEETTEKAILREYTAAWKALVTALSENRTGQLPPSFTGAARDTIAQQVEQQKQNGMSVRIIDRGHKLDAAFYSPEGSAMQLRDVVELEKQYLNGGRVVHSEKITQSYVVLMSVAEDRWKVRLLQELQ